MQDTLANWQIAIGAWPIAEAVRGTVWVKALLESFHILSLGLVLFAAGMAALGLAAPSPTRSTADTMRRFSPWLWSGLAVVFVTGILLLTGAGARRGLPAPMFQLKMTVMAISILLAAALQWTVGRYPQFWEHPPGGRLTTKVVASVYFLAWVFTVYTGRWLAYGYVLFPNE